MIQKAIFAEGCFWGVESVFRKIKGVHNVTVGYTGGSTSSPHYEEVCEGSSGRAEAVLVEYEDESVSYEELLDIFWTTHNPTTLNRQGPDIGEQYRSAIFYLDDVQKNLAEESKEKVQEQYMQNIVTEIVEAVEFFPAEEYHQRYFEKKGIDPTCHV